MGSRAVGQSGSRAVGQSGSRAVGQSGSRAVGQSGSRAVYFSPEFTQPTSPMPNKKPPHGGGLGLLSGQPMLQGFRFQIRST